MQGVRAQGVRGSIAVAVGLAGAIFVPAQGAAMHDGPTVLPGGALGVVTADLDGDGQREMVRLLQDENGLGQAVDAWAHDGTAWSTLGATPIPTVDALDEAQRGIAQGAWAILRSRVDGADRVLVLSAELESRNDGTTCCLSVAEMGLTRAGRIELGTAQVVGGGAQLVQAVDVDDDGTDELVLHGARYGPEGEGDATLRVLRRSSSGFAEIFSASEPALLNGFFAAETDGVAGVDLLYGPLPDGRLHRVAWADGELRPEEAPIDVGGPPDGWISGAAGGAIVIAVAEAIIAVRWPRGEEPRQVRRPTRTYPSVSVIGDGPEALVVAQESFRFQSMAAPRTSILDLGLRQLGEVAPSTASDAFWELLTGDRSPRRGILHNVFPYAGPLIGGMPDGRSAFVASGTLIVPGGPTGYEARAMASLIGMGPAGLVGPDDGYVVLSDAFGPHPGTAYLTWGGVPFGRGRVVVTRLEEVLRPDDAADLPEIDLHGAVEVADERTAALMADGNGFQISVSEAPGTIVMLSRGGAPIEEHQLSDVPLLLDVLPNATGREEANQEFEATLYLVGPDGRGAVRRWTGTFIREPPEISVTAATEPLALSATLAGRTSAGSQVSANGAPIETDVEGRFSVLIDAPIWPSQVVVIARDRLGNEATRQVEVVGLVDYRGLPWPALLVSLTVALGAILYRQAPKRQPRSSTDGGDGRLEELELDVTDGIEPRTR